MINITQLIHFFDPKDHDQMSNNVNKDLELISQYSKEHNLVINPNKTKMILLSSKQSRQDIVSTANIKLNNTQIRFSDSMKVLGLTIDSTLIFREHLGMILQKCSI